MDIELYADRYEDLMALIHSAEYQEEPEHADCPHCQGSGVAEVIREVIEGPFVGEAWLDEIEVPCTSCGGLGYLSEEAA